MNAFAPTKTHKDHQREPSSLSVGFEALPKEHEMYFSLFIKHTFSSKIHIANKAKAKSTF